MRYTPQNYARAVLSLLPRKGPAERTTIIKNFLATLRKRGDRRRLADILREIERQHLRETGIHKVKIETPARVAPETREAIEEILGGAVFFEEKINPKILAGIRILINSELLVDATAKSRLRVLFQKG